MSLSYFHRCFPLKWFPVAMAAGGNQGSIRYSSSHRCCVHRHTAVSVETETQVSDGPRAGEQVNR